VVLHPHASHGELLKLGINISQATVGRWMQFRPTCGIASGAMAGLLTVTFWNNILGKPAYIDGLVIGVFANPLVFVLTPAAAAELADNAAARQRGKPLHRIIKPAHNDNDHELASAESSRRSAGRPAGAEHLAHEPSKIFATNCRASFRVAA
jgi:hypothetical protein